MASSFGQKLGGKNCKGYFGHLSTLKLFGRCLGPSEKPPSLIISVLRLSIFLNASPSQFTFSSSLGNISFMTSILLLPCEHKKHE